MKSNQFNKNEAERNYSPLSELGTLNYIDDPKRVTGMFLSGQIMDRSRRKVPRNDPQIEIVTYLIQDNHGKKYYVDYFDPHGYYKIGENVCIPIYIKPYQRKTGELGYTIYIQKPSSQTVRGEHF